jgi:pyrroline-5-carboxylate reductase
MAAAFSIGSIEQAIGRPFPVFRAMPNTPVVVREGAICIAANAHARQEHYAVIEPIFRSVGTVAYVTEDQLHAVTALSGAGPAYVFTVIEALTAGGLKVGLPRDIAARLAAQTVLGAAKLAVGSGVHPAVLRDQVVTPGGVTIAGLHELERLGLRAMFMTAVERATDHSRNLAQKLNETPRKAE